MLKSPHEEHADYWDFVYFSFVIGMTAQVSDVGIIDKTIRRTATVHGIISFVFNTALLAPMVNIAARLYPIPRLASNAGTPSSSSSVRVRLPADCGRRRKSAKSAGWSMSTAIPG
jgi:hypothetical protein